MSLVRNALLLGIFVMLLPAEQKSQRGQMQAAAARTLEHSATYCERNPRTCETARELWAQLVTKAEQGVELGARALQEHLRHAVASNAARAPSFDDAPAQPAARFPEHRRQTSLENPGRWR